MAVRFHRRDLIMFDPQKIDEMARKITGMMPPGVGRFQDEIEKNLKAGLAGLLQKMDLVTREEYEVQVALLARTREKLEQLDRQLKMLEEKLKT
jgi:BMFP domain-containing protein YqiC